MIYKYEIACTYKTSFQDVELNICWFPRKKVFCFINFFPCLLGRTVSDCLHVYYMWRSDKTSGKEYKTKLRTCVRYPGHNGRVNIEEQRAELYILL